MFFREYCEFIEVLYVIYYSKMNDYEKNNNYRKIITNINFYLNK